MSVGAVLQLFVHLSTLFPTLVQSIFFLNNRKHSEKVGTPACKCATQFLADSTNGRAYATVLRPSVCLSSSSVCNVMYCG